jgi:hypothetical protein
MFRWRAQSISVGEKINVNNQSENRNTIWFSHSPFDIHRPLLERSGHIMDNREVTVVTRRLRSLTLNASMREMAMLRQQ